MVILKAALILEKEKFVSKIREFVGQVRNVLSWVAESVKAVRARLISFLSDRSFTRATWLQRESSRKVSESINNNCFVKVK